MPSKKLLQLRQRYPLELKIAMTKSRIRQWYEYWQGDVYVSFSGGKDSAVSLDIARQLYPNIEAVFIDTGLEYPEIRNFVNAFNNVTWLRPEMTFRQVIEKYGYPVIGKEVADCIQGARKGQQYRIDRLNGTLKNKTGGKSDYCQEKYAYLLDAPFKISHYCCNAMKKKPAHNYEKMTGNKPMIATMTDESRLREKAWERTGCNAFKSKRPISTPLSFWTEQDVLHYIVDNHIDYASVYGDIVPKSEFLGQIAIDTDMTDLVTTGCQRTGCMFCMFGCHLEKEQNRFQRMKVTHPDRYKYCINGGEYVNGLWQPNNKGLGIGKVLDFIEVSY